MTCRDKNQLIKLLIDKNTKPDLSKYELEQLILMYLDFRDNNCNWTEIFSMYSAKTIDILNSICIDVPTSNEKNDKLMNKIYNIDGENEKKKIIVDFIVDLWKKFPLVDESGDVVECGICLNYITNIDNMSLRCGHKIHSSCFVNYLFTNLKNTRNSSSNNDLIFLFRCPNCRINLTDTIDEYSNNINNIDNGDDEITADTNLNFSFNQEYINIDQNDFFTNNYDLISNSITNTMVNNLFRRFNPINDFHIGSGVFVDYNHNNIFGHHNLK